MTVPQARALNDSEMHSIEQEIADIYLVCLSDELGLIVLEATTKKLKINEKRYPPENFGMIKK